MKPKAIVCTINEEYANAFFSCLESAYQFDYTVSSSKIISESSDIDHLFRDLESPNILLYKCYVSKDLKKRLIVAAQVYQKNLLYVDHLICDSTSALSLQCLPYQIEHFFEFDTRFSYDKNLTHFSDAHVLITGGAGSIGSQLVKLVAQCKPQQLTIVDQNEEGLWRLKNQLGILFPNVTIQCILLDLTDFDSLDYLFSQNNFTTVFHTAAYKQLPLLQDHIYIAAKINLIATINLVKLSHNNTIKRFLYLSSDKACNPTSILGLTKRAAEIYITSFKEQNKSATIFNTVRLGNIVNSSGSVIPTFNNQLNHNLPLTITHNDSKRYYLNNKNACELIIESLFLEKNTSVLILKMGEMLSIIEVLKLLFLFRNKPFSERTIKHIGLRSGEKLIEVLHNNTAKVSKTNNPLIFAIEETQLSSDKVRMIVEQLETLCSSYNEEKILDLLKQLVPEYQ